MRITLITPSLDRVEWISHAIDSVVAQKDPNLEHIVVDGGSKDGTLEMLRRRYPQVRRIVEKRGNLYDALNIGIRHATGEIIGFLNTDDRLAESALSAIRRGFADHPDADMLCGGCRVAALDKAADRVGTRLFDDPALFPLSPGHLISGPILTNGRFFRRRVFPRVGPFDSTWKIFADREWLARCFLQGITGRGIGTLVYIYGAHAGSLTFSGDLGPRHLEEPVLLARAGLARATSRRERAFYRRWHGWACGYRWLRSSGAGMGEMAAAFAVDPLWPGFFLAHGLWHGATRRQRRGRSGG